MKKTLFFAAMMLIAVGCCQFAAADDYKDDAYFKPYPSKTAKEKNKEKTTTAADTVKTVPASVSSVQKTPQQSQQATQKVRIVQDNGTVVKAVIKR